MSANDFTAREAAWAGVELEAKRLKRARLLDLFAADPKRAEALTFAAPHLLADFSKQRLDAGALQSLKDLAEAMDFSGQAPRVPRKRMQWLITNMC